MDDQTERFVDEERIPIPRADTWHELTIHQLYEIRAMLQDKQFFFRQQPVIQKALVDSLKRLDDLILIRAYS